MASWAVLAWLGAAVYPRVCGGSPSYNAAGHAPKVIARIAGRRLRPRRSLRLRRASGAGSARGRRAVACWGSRRAVGWRVASVGPRPRFSGRCHRPPQLSGAIWLSFLAWLWLGPRDGRPGVVPWGRRSGVLRLGSCPWGLTIRCGAVGSCPWVVAMKGWCPVVVAVGCAAAYDRLFHASARRLCLPACLNSIPDHASGGRPVVLKRGYRAGTGA